MPEVTFFPAFSSSVSFKNGIDPFSSRGPIGLTSSNFVPSVAKINRHMNLLTLLAFN